MADSLYLNRTNNTKQIFYIMEYEYTNIEQNPWKYKFDERFEYFISPISSNLIGKVDKIKPFLSHIMKVCYDASGGDGWLVYTNSDISVSYDFYDVLEKNCGFDALLFHKEKVLGIPKSYEDIISHKYPRETELCGVDGFAIKSDKYYEGLIPDFLIGEPAWDIIVADIFEDKFNTNEIFGCLYEPYHKQNWKWDINDMSIHNIYMMAACPELKNRHHNRIIKYGCDINKYKIDLENKISTQYS